MLPIPSSPLYYITPFKLHLSSAILLFRVVEAVERGDLRRRRSLGYVVDLVSGVRSWAFGLGQCRNKAVIVLIQRICGLDKMSGFCSPSAPGVGQLGLVARCQLLAVNFISFHQQKPKICLYPWGPFGTMQDPRSTLGEARGAMHEGLLHGRLGGILEDYRV